MNKYILILLLACTSHLAGQSAQKKVIYKASDSIKVEKLLKEAAHLPKNTNKVLFFARKFIGIPYVAHTLEIGETENLVVNLDELDCTTYVDVVTALTLASQNRKNTFKDFCHYLQHQRYPNGVITDYTSRNHYYSSWILNCEKQGFTHEINSEDCKKGHFCASQKILCNYMTKHPDKYKALSEHPEYIKAIKSTESQLNSMTVKYIPNHLLGLSQKKLDCIQNGDILALVTSKEGLDVSHLGFAVWQGGRLHLLNASSLYKKVVLDKNTLQSYNTKQRTNIGVRVIRILQP